MINFSVCSIVVQLPLDYQPGQSITVKMLVPENAIPLQVDHRAPIVGIPGVQPTPGFCTLHYLVPCDAEGRALCEVCNERTADYDGVICTECKGQEDSEQSPEGGP